MWRTFPCFQRIDSRILTAPFLHSAHLVKLLNPTGLCSLLSFLSPKDSDRVLLAASHQRCLKSPPPSHSALWWLLTELHEKKNKSRYFLAKSIVLKLHWLSGQSSAQQTIRNFFWLRWSFRGRIFHCVQFWNVARAVRCFSLSWLKAVTSELVALTTLPSWWNWKYT